MRAEGSRGPRRHLSSSTRAALADTRLVEIVPAGPSRLHSSAPPRSDEAPVVLHAFWAPTHPRRTDVGDGRAPARRTHVLHPGVAPKRGPRPGRRPRPVVPFDIPIEAFAVEVGGGAHPSVRSLGDRRLVYVEHRLAARRMYRRRQVMLAFGISGAFVAVAAVALAPRGAVASDVPEPAPAAPVAAPAVAAAPSIVRPAPHRPVDPIVAAVPAKKAGASRPAPPVRPADPGWRKSWRSGPVAAAGASTTATPPMPDDRNVYLGPPTTAFGYQGGPLARNPFLVCTRWYESVFAGGYGAKSPGGQYRGAYQFDQITWNAVARHLGRAELVGVDPARVAPATQDLFAYTLYKWQGASHWNYRCDGLP